MFLVKEEKTRLLKERLDQMHFVNERCSQAPVYGRDLLSICSLPGRGSFDSSLRKGPGPAGCYMSPSKSKGDLILTLNQRQESLQDVLNR
jgi:E1A-binding protein p400